MALRKLDYATRGIWAIIALMKKPIVSVVCTNYNKGEWIRTAIESFLKQKTDFTFEVILIDDASTDDSKEIIREYEKKYPNKIRALYNKKNLGITRTWIKVCEEAKGKYIARCDGDDYWKDKDKLQKQVNALNDANDSEWCSTDCDTLDSTGNFDFSVFENRIIDHAGTYAKMLATKGFIAPSTWLVDADLMRQVNKSLDTDTVDDTFNIQLELFNQTQLTYLPVSTTVYRINEGSDSRPIDMDKIKSRHDGLLKTQLEYVRKYKNTEYDEIIEILLHKNNEYELLLIDRLRIIRELQNNENRLNEQIATLNEQIRKRDQQIINILNSKRYKLGKMLVSPASLIKPKSGK